MLPNADAGRRNRDHTGDRLTASPGGVALADVNRTKKRTLQINHESVQPTMPLIRRFVDSLILFLCILASLAS